MSDSVTEITAKLSAPFEAREVKWKPQSVKGNRALAIAYIDCRVVQDRLDDVLGVENWRDEYTILNDGSVVCRLALKLSGEWVAKEDVGSPSEQPDGGDRLKAAFSDALKRVAVKFGIGRYIYRLGHQWVDYDPQKKQFTQTPQLPAWALPKKAAGATTEQPKPAPQQQAPAKPQPGQTGGGPSDNADVPDGWTDAEMDALISEKKWTWPWVVGAINKSDGTTYPDATKISDNRLFAFMDWLTTQPVFQPKPQPK